MVAVVPWFTVPVVAATCLPLPWLVGRWCGALARHRCDDDVDREAPRGGQRRAAVLLLAAFAVAAGALVAQAPELVPGGNTGDPTTAVAGWAPDLDRDEDRVPFAFMVRF